MTFDDGSIWEWTEQPDWKPVQVADTQLVACVHAANTEKGTCFFTDGGRKYYNRTVTITLRRADTGEEIDDKRWSCTGDCNDFCENYPVTLAEELQWLEPYVETP